VLGRRQKWFLMALPVVLVLLLSLVLHAPASLVLSRLAPVMTANGVDSSNAGFGGILLDGQLQTRRQGMPLYIAWRLQLSSLWRFAYGADLTLGGPVALKANWQKQPGQWSLQITDVLTQAGDASWLLPQLVMPTWRSEGMRFTRNTQGEWLNASGELVTQGGMLRLNLQGQIQEMQIPAATLRWRIVNKNVVGELKQLADGGDLAAITLTADQRIQWQIRERLLRLKPGYLGKNDLDLVVLTVSEPLSSQGD
jgi:hypothetical protein